MMNNVPCTPAERDELLLTYFHSLDDIGQNLALVLLHAIAGNPALHTRPEPESAQAPTPPQD